MRKARFLVVKTARLVREMAQAIRSSDRLIAFGLSHSNPAAGG
jgi:hypothetical protein